MTKKIYVISGGTMVHIRPHFAISAPAYGNVGREVSDRLHKLIWQAGNVEGNIYEGEPEVNKTGLDVVPVFTRMASHQVSQAGTLKGKVVIQKAGLKRLETNDDMAQLVTYLVAQPDTRAIILAAAICDWEPSYMSQDEVRQAKSRVDGKPTGEPWVQLDGEFMENKFGKDKPRLSSRLKGAEDHRKGVSIHFRAAKKILPSIRAGANGRKDVFLVSFKTTAGVTREETYAAGLRSLKGSSSNLVFANDVQNHHNVVVTPEEFPYYGDDRDDALDTLCEMIYDRVQLDFVRTTVIEGERAQIGALHESGDIPANFAPVLRHCLDAGAYKVLPWKDSTSGHFGTLVSDHDFVRISSVRKANHNLVFQEGVAKIYSEEANAPQILAAGARPSVGEHTQRMIYEEIKNKGGEVHSIIHFHCPLRLEHEKGSGIIDVPTRPQKPYECGSVQCGLNTATGMMEIYPGIWAVHLDGHGPNIAWHRDVPALAVVKFIGERWVLSEKSGGNLTGDANAKAQ